MKSLKSALLAISLCLTSLSAHAIPITYSFSTGTAPIGDATFLPLFIGLSVTGTFDYDPDVAVSGTSTAPQTAGSTDYLNGITNLIGSVGAFSFSDLIGRVRVGDDKFTLLGPSPPPPTDILVLTSAFVTTGFDIDGFSLLNVRQFWIEDPFGDPLGITDFLTDQNLPGVLPAFAGRLALDFAPTGDLDPQSNRTFVFFDDLIVRQVPEPTTLSLLGAALIGFGLVRRRKRAA